MQLKKLKLKFWRKNEHELLKVAKTPLQKSLFKVAVAISTLYMLVIVSLFGVAFVNQRQSHTSCLISQRNAENQVTSLTNLQASAKEFRDHARNPQVRAFFKVSYQRRTASLKKAETDLAKIHC